MAIEDLKPIQRYEFEDDPSYKNEYHEILMPNKDGEWCKWEDVDKAWDEVTKILLDHLTETLKDLAK